MKNLVFLGAAFAVTVVSAAVPDVSGVLLVQTGARCGEVTYTLAADAVVTVDFQTNGVFWTDARDVLLIGDVQRKVAAGDRAFTFTMPESPEESAVLTAAVRAWPLDSPPDYMVVDLVATNTVRYYASSNAVPGNLQDKIYRTDKLVLRKIPAKNASFVMGLPSGDRDYNANDLTPRVVSFTKDFYIGVWEATRAQYRNMWKAYSYNLNDVVESDRTNYGVTTAETRPMKSGNVTYYILRGNTNNTEDASALWPRDGHKVGAHSVLAMVRGVTGVEFDLPTEAQWEFACHGGFTTGLGDGNEIEYHSAKSPTLLEVAWCNENSGGTSHATGLKKPNGYGLYDMHGNIFERVLDRYVANADESVVGGTDPRGPTDTTVATCVRKGGHYANDASWYHAAFRSSLKMNSGDDYYGFRLACPAEAK